MRRAACSFFLLACSHGTALNTDSASTLGPNTEPPRACVDPDVHVRRLDADWVNYDRPTEEQRLDLDGVAPLDRLLALPGMGGSGGTTYALYAMRGGCGEYVGDVFSQEVSASSASSNGLRDLSLVAAAGSCDVTHSRAVFDGTRYVSAPVEVCTCVPGEGEPSCRAARTSAD